MMTINDINDYFKNLGGSTKGIENFRNCMNELNNPQDSFKTIQILGTNGKGSTTAFMQKLLTTKYDKVATFTSPAIVTIYDRIQINCCEIFEEDFVLIFNEIFEVIVKYQLGFFEVLTVIAFIYFERNGVDIAVIEAGLGGKHDCTSIINPEVRLLTNIGLDHTNILGNTEEEICLQKLGALKSNEHLITTIDNKFMKIVEEFCESNNVSFTHVTKPTTYNVSLIGEHQKMNASLALACVDYLNIKIENVEQLLSEVVWMGRFQKVQNNFYIDGAHNELGIRSAIATANQVFGKNNYKVVFSVLKDKDLDSILKLFTNEGILVTFTTFDYARAYNKDELVTLNINYETDYSILVEEALHNKECNYLFTGSLYFVTEILMYLNNRNS